MIRPLNLSFIIIIICFLIATSCWAYTAVVEWRSNSEPDLAEYTVYFGRQSRIYENYVNVGKSTMYAIEGLKKEEIYYIAITATNTTGLESDYSAEVTVNYTEIEAFVTRFYQYCLDCSPDQNGLGGWVAFLLEDFNIGATVAHGFVFSPKLISKNISNTDFLTVSYKAFFDRNPDQTGWMDGSRL